MLVAVFCTFVHFCFWFFFGFWSLQHFFGGRNLRGWNKDWGGFSIILTLFLLSHGVPPVPSGPPRKVEVEAVNSSSIKVIWRSPVPTKQHGQIRGYQVHYVRMVNGEPTGQPVIKDILIDDAQVQQHPPSTQPDTQPAASFLRHVVLLCLIHLLTFKWVMAIPFTVCKSLESSLILLQFASKKCFHLEL